MQGPLDPAFAGPVRWPAKCTVGPGLEGAIACESAVGYVNGSQGALIYRGYDIFDLCAYSNFEEVSYLLIHGSLPTRKERDEFCQRLVRYRHIPATLRQLMSFPVEHMNAMAVLRMGTTLMRQEFSLWDRETGRREAGQAIGTDEDSIAMETMPRGEPHAVYEFENAYTQRAWTAAEKAEDRATGLNTCYHLLAGVATMAAATARLRHGQMPLDPDPRLSHAANYLYMMTGRQPSPVEERIMDVALILHADHGMNASTFASVVVASTLADM
jgi:citrate synthase